MDTILKIVAILALATAVKAQAGLLGLVDRRGVEVWTDDDEFDKKIKVWRPDLPTSNWRTSGQVVQSNYNPLAQPIYRFRNRVESEAPDMTRPEGFVWVWDDRLSRAEKDASIWKVTCKPGYVALSDFFHPENRIVNPVGLFDEASCFKESLTEACPIGGRIWDDSGSGAWFDVSVWATKASSTQVQGHFFANSKQDEAPNVKSRCLRKNAFTEL